MDATDYSKMSFDELKHSKNLAHDPNLQYELGVRYTCKDYDNRHDLKIGCKYLRKAMLGGHPSAQSYLEQVLIHDVNYTKSWIEYLFTFFLECNELGKVVDHDIMYNCDQLLNAPCTEWNGFSKYVEVKWSDGVRRIKEEDLDIPEHIVLKYEKEREKIRQSEMRQYKQDKDDTRRWVSILLFALVAILIGVAYFFGKDIAIKLLIVFAISFTPLTIAAFYSMDIFNSMEDIEGPEANGAAVGCIAISCLVGLWTIVTFIGGMIWFLLSLF